MPDGKDLLRRDHLAIRYAAYTTIFTAVLLSLGLGDRGTLALVGPLLLLGAAAGSVSLHKAWASSFRTLYGIVTVMAAFWAQLSAGTPFYAGWTVLLLGVASILLGGLSLETNYLAERAEDVGGGRTSLRRAALRLGAYLFVVSVVALLAVLGSFAFVLGTLPLWALGICTAALVLVFAYLVSQSAQATDQSG